ncbi:hypothetical protein A9Q99_05570 [Gammaproteobacteria bacterium 45_16_T64]|nr:hypothetical protein A9Q99_05570 [Gammaproteobacteria bacterium 45_16_T64]
MLRGRWFISALLFCVSFSGWSQANGGGWVIDRERKPDSPLLRQGKAIANLSEEERQHRAIVLAFRQATEKYQGEIRQHWPSSEVSSKTRWVTYSEDWSSKRVVDFEKNHIEISVENQFANRRIDFGVLSKTVQKELEVVLGSSISGALAKDPVQRAVDRVITQYSKEPPSAEDGGLVLEELFTKASPTPKAISKKAKLLLKNASIRYQVLTASIAALPIGGNKKITYTIPLPDNRIRKKVRKFAPIAKKNAQRFDLSSDVVMAIIHTESHFNPLARSGVPAFGLMQIVPATAGRDAAKKLYKKSKLLSARYLYNPSRNIEAGAAYLHVLYYNYLKGIKNPESRLYYAIASYNGGASSSAKAFIKQASFKKALSVINSMTPDQVLKTLMTKLPRRETREYVSKVLKRRNYYKRV